MWVLRVALQPQGCWQFTNPILLCCGKWGLSEVLMSCSALFVSGLYQSQWVTMSALAYAATLLHQRAQTHGCVTVSFTLWRCLHKEMCSICCVNVWLNTWLWFHCTYSPLKHNSIAFVTLIPLTTQIWCGCCFTYLIWFNIWMIPLLTDWFPLRYLTPDLLLSFSCCKVSTVLLRIN